MQNFRISGGLAFVGLAMMFAAACGSDTGDDIEYVSPYDDTPVAFSGPIGERLQASNGLDAATQRWQQELQETVAVCMAEKGFEYITSAPIELPSLQAQLELDVRQWTAEFGYGIVASFEENIRATLAEPNSLRLSAMTESERSRFSAALSGEAIAEGRVGAGERMPPLKDQGCAGLAVLETIGDSAWNRSIEFEEEYNFGLDRLTADSRVVEATALWSRCMADVGFAGMESIGAPEEFIDFRLTGLKRDILARFEFVEPSDLPSILAAAEEDLSTLPGLNSERLEDIRIEEITMATADLACYVQHLQNVLEPAQVELEGSLVEEYDDYFTAIDELGD